MNLPLIAMLALIKRVIVAVGHLGDIHRRGSSLILQFEGKMSLALRDSKCSFEGETLKKILGDFYQQMDMVNHTDKRDFDAISFEVQKFLMEHSRIVAVALALFQSQCQSLALALMEASMALIAVL